MNHKSKHPLYGTWCQIKRRTTNPNAENYPYYGGRGITLYKPWFDDFESFARFIESELGLKRKGSTLDRIDNGKGYEPGNLRWASPSEQNRNRRDNREHTLNGEALCLSEWSSRLGVPAQTLRNRLKNGETFEAATQGGSRDEKQITFNDQSKSIAAWERELGFKKSTLVMRLRRGWTVERALTTPVKR